MGMALRESRPGRDGRATRSSWARSSATWPRPAPSTQGDDGQLGRRRRRAARVGLPVSVKGGRGASTGGGRKPTPNVCWALAPRHRSRLRRAAAVGRCGRTPYEDAVIDLCDAAAGRRRPADHRRSRPLHVRPRSSSSSALTTGSPPPVGRALADWAIAEQLEAHRRRGPVGGFYVPASCAHHWAAAVQPTDAAKAIHYAGARRGACARGARPGRGASLVHPGARAPPTAYPTPTFAGEPRSSSASASLSACGASPPTVKTLLEGGPAGRRHRFRRSPGAGHARQQPRLEQHHRRARPRTGRGLFDRALDRLDDPNSADRARPLCLAACEPVLLGGSRRSVSPSCGKRSPSCVAGRRGRRPHVGGPQRAAVATRSPATLVPRTAWLTEHQSLLDGSTDLADYSTHGEQILSSHGEHMLTAIEQGDRARVEEEWAAIQAIS